MMIHALQGSQSRAPMVPLSYPSPPRPVSTMHRRLEDLQYRDMESAFHATGGLVSCNELVRLLRKRSNEPLALLSGWVGGREAISFEWNSQTLLPMFQFELPVPALRPCVTNVVGELSDVFDAWDLSLWFARPNAWLANAPPVDKINRNPQAVIDAARADRYVARG